MWRRAAWALIGAAVLYSLAVRIYLLNVPLWLDESWTAVISSSPNFTDWIHQVWADSNAPLYYFLIWLWPFESDIGLRVPSLLFLLGTAAVALGAPIGKARWLWAALLLLWYPGFSLSIDARYYTLLMLLATAQVVVFLRLLESPGIGLACGWAALASLSFLTHYMSAPLALMQGLIFMWREKAFRYWPSLLIGLPALAWFAFHWPRLVQYAAHPWQERIGTGLPHFVTWPITGWEIAALPLAGLVSASRKKLSGPVLGAVSAACGALLLITLVGLLRPMMMDRYLLALVPSLLLGIATSLRFWARVPAVVIYLLCGDWPAVQKHGLNERGTFGLELPARHLPDVKRVSWHIDSFGASIYDADQMRRMLADAFRRNGRVIEPRWGHLESGDAYIAIGKPPQTNWRCVRINTTSICRRPE